MTGYLSIGAPPPNTSERSTFYRNRRRALTKALIVTKPISDDELLREIEARCAEGKPFTILVFNEGHQFRSNGQ